jgi:hypothetical protein
VRITLNAGAFSSYDRLRFFNLIKSAFSIKRDDCANELLGAELKAGISEVSFTPGM